jgi:hypothetical protein
MSDKRQHKRVPLTSFVILTLGDGDDVISLKTFTADISMSGIGLYSDKPVRLDRDVSLAVNFVGPENLATEYIEGRIIYINRLGDFYFMGIEFRQEIDPGRQPLLHQRIQRILGYYSQT